MNPIIVLGYLEGEAWFLIQACKMDKNQGKHPWHGRRLTTIVHVIYIRK